MKEDVTLVHRKYTRDSKIKKYNYCKRDIMNRRFYLFKKLWIGGDCEGLVFVRLDAFSHDSLLPMYHLPLEPCFPDFTLCYIL